MDKVIETRGLTKYYGAALGIRDVDLVVRQGEVFGFLGPNGAGKTTTIRLLLGLLRPTRGEIRLLGQDTRRRFQSLLRDIGYLPGDFGLYGDLTGAQYLEYLMRLRAGRPTPEQKAAMNRLMRRFEIDFAKKIHGYSKGMKQVVGIIQAFMHLPRLTILDEPTSGLDPIMQEAFYELLVEETGRGAAIFFSSHILREVERVCGRVGMIKEGRLLNVEAMNERGALLGKKIAVKAPRDAAAMFQRLSELDGVHDAALRGGTLELLFTGDMRQFLRFLAPFEIQDLTCEPPNTEDVFLRLYRADRDV